MASCGSCEQELRGGTCRSGMVRGAQLRADFIDGSKRGCGNESWKPYNSKPMQQERLIGRSTVSIARLSAPINMQQEQKGGSKPRGIRQESGWFQHETAFAGRWQRETDDLCADSWSTGIVNLLKEWKSLQKRRTRERKKQKKRNGQCSAMPQCLFR